MALDDVTREIFHEEFTEQLSLIHDRLAVWHKQTAQTSAAQNPESVSHALTDIRRAFHTLKGSGRMVGATALGDFAWVYEDVLNQVLGGVCQPNIALYEVLSEAWQGLQAHTDALLINNQLPADLLAQQAHIQQWLAVSLHGDQAEALSQPSSRLSAEQEASPTQTINTTPALTESTLVDSAAMASLETETANVQATADTAIGDEPTYPATPATSISSIASNHAPIACLDPEICESLCDEFIPLLTTLKVLQDNISEDESCIPILQTQLKSAYALLLPLSDSPLTALFESLSQLSKQQWHDTSTQTTLQCCLRFAEDYVSRRSTVEQLADCEQALKALHPQKDGLIAKVPRGVINETESAEAELAQLTRLLHDEEASGEHSELTDVLADDTAESLSDRSQHTADHPYKAADIDLDIHYILADVAQDTAQNTSNSVIEIDEQITPTAVKAPQETVDHLTKSLAKPEVSQQQQRPDITTSLDSHSAPDSEAQLVMQLFLEDVPELLADLEQAFEAVQQCVAEGTLGERESADLIQNLERQLHTIKGGARMANCYDLADQAHGLEERLNQLGDHVAELESALPSLQLGIDLLYGQFDKILYNALSEAYPTPEPTTDTTDAGSAIAVIPSANISPEASVEAIIKSRVEGKGNDANLVSDIDLSDATVLDHQRITDLETTASESVLEPTLIHETTVSLSKQDIQAIKKGQDEPVQMNNLLGEKAEIVDPTDSLQVLRREVVLKEGFNSVLAELIHEQAEALISLSDRPPQTPLDVAADTSQQREREMIRLPSQTIDDLIGTATEMNVNQSRLFGHLQHLGNDTEELTRTVTRLRQQLRALDMEIEAQIRHDYQHSGEVISDTLVPLEQLGQAQRGQEDFDPLELDEYAEVQQLSRQLSEGLNDLINLEQDISSERLRIQQLLGQQSHTGRDMQQALLNTRMTAIEQIVPRLKRVARQTAESLGKHVDFQIEGADSELDRVIIQSMLAPLEHMIRNAISHGIETPDKRVSQQKPEQGLLRLSIERQSAEIILSLSDDGQGINRQRVRDIALEQQLIQADEVLSDNELCRLILRAGFTTSTQVDQISGRGIGMDVVYTAIKNMGGSLSIESALPPHDGQVDDAKVDQAQAAANHDSSSSEPFGVGTRFIIHLPLTLATNQVLLVEASGQSFALPMNNIVGLQRLAAADLSTTIKQPSDTTQTTQAEEDSSANKSPVQTLRYQHQDYRLYHLGELIGRSSSPRQHTEQKMPIVFLRCEGEKIALQLDNLIGNREIILKPLPNWAEIPALYATASIQPDGEVILVLNVAELVHWRMPSTPSVALDASSQNSVKTPKNQRANIPQAPTILVVDDSITVRKVTEKLLLAHHYRVLTAKDGMDALELLAQEAADLLLLDIEMPRMDGFELMVALRGQESYQTLPVIMISSRSGEKHKEKARTLGVNDFMGKPYQEDVLLQTIQRLLLTQE
ncbi:MAG: response regulator [bacterium]